MRTYFNGTYRHLFVNPYQKKANKCAVIMMNGFIEQGYWYHIEVDGYSLAKKVHSKGYDVFVLSFLPNVVGLKKNIADSSFDEIVGDKIPRFHKQIVEQYDAIFYIGHSYGATLALAYLLGYPEESISLQNKELNQTKVKGMISLAGAFSVSPEFFKQDFLVSSGLNLLKNLPIKKLQSMVPLVPFNLLRNLRYLPSAQIAKSIVSKVIPMPMVNWDNAHPEALLKALAHGSQLESVESVRTVFGLGDHPDATPALKDFASQLKGFSLPILFLQGEEDRMTPPEAIRKRGFDCVSSEDKSFENIKKTGHQDLLTGRNVRQVTQKIINWLDERKQTLS